MLPALAKRGKHESGLKRGLLHERGEEENQTTIHSHLTTAKRTEVKQQCD